MLIFHLWVNLIPQFAASRHPTGKDKTENYINTRKLNAAQLNRQTDRQTDKPLSANHAHLKTLYINSIITIIITILEVATG